MARPSDARGLIGIAAPVSGPEEVSALAEAGATELYCGVIPPTWAARYGSPAWLNRRGSGKANLPSLEHLEALLAAARTAGLPVSVAMNAPFYTGDQQGDVLELCAALGDLGADRVIVADIGLVHALHDGGASIPVTVSSVAAIRNSSTAQLFAELGVRRIVLPRHVSLDEMAAIRRAIGPVELEIFVLNDGCVYEEGFCATTHALGTFCTTAWDYEVARSDGKALGARETGRLEENLDHYREWIGFVNNCGCTYSPRGLPNGPCGLCAISDLVAMGVDCLKIVGREAHPYRKVRSVQMVSAVVRELEEGASPQAAARFSRELRDTPELCDAGYMCYYREVCARGHFAA